MIFQAVLSYAHRTNLKSKDALLMSRLEAKNELNAVAKTNWRQVLRKLYPPICPNVWN